MSHTDAKKAIIGCSIGCVVCCLLGLLFENETPVLFNLFAGLAIALAIGVFVFNLFWRCPYCGKDLPLREILTIQHCVHCGNKL